MSNEEVSAESEGMEGMLQVYTGNGKGKTTAALGLSLRAVGAGLSVFIGQFIKGREYSELKVLSGLKGLTVRQYGQGRFITGKPDKEDIRLARKGLKEIGEILSGGTYQLVVLDEACVAADLELFSASELLSTLEGRREDVEVVVTGRSAPPELLETADLVTEMREIKHYFHRGVRARVGIEK